MIEVQANPRPLTKPEAARARSLAELAREIVAERDAAKLAAKTAIEHAIRCGELLIQAKAQCRHGNFETWAADHCGRCKSAYTGYMRRARRQAELPAPDMPIRDSLKLLAETRGTRPTGEQKKSPMS
jgi:hypothetical protein